MTRRRTAKPWARRLWGVEFRGSDPRLRPHLLGTAWLTNRSPSGDFYPGEPTRPLLFTTRAAARAWCDAKQSAYAQDHDRCADWRFRPVRVLETVRVVETKLERKT